MSLDELYTELIVPIFNKHKEFGKQLESDANVESLHSFSFNKLEFYKQYVKLHLDKIMGQPNILSGRF